jgi:glycosyltransferase involved in cell wall biosynthesis
VYVAAAAKEEFGLAIVEALGVGLTVVAPDAGGPPTYVAHSDTGILADTQSPARLRRAISDARQLVDRDGRADRARALVRDRLTVEAMAAALVTAYETARVSVA